ncbi:cytochrome c [Thioploca ingrica]|uniref:Cytochrome c n=1 Tax=Thioploca ingrica TaxID=40754 RepID=A0A090BVT3_9GAMM|nr:cytochrome c [Thioploca ingrica]
MNSFGRAFKLKGYTLTESELSSFGDDDENGSAEKRPVPVAGMLVLSASKTKNKDATGTVDLNKDGDVVVQQASLFTGGRITKNLGAFVQATYDGVEHHTALDITDIRYAMRQRLSDKDLTWGVTLNNDPSAQDVWNSTPTWGYPYTSSSVAPTPAAATQIEGGLAQQVGGLGVYGLWDNWLYGELSLYWQGKTGLFRPLTAGTTVSSLTKGVTPYWRLAVQQDWDKHYLAVGLLGMITKLYPEDMDSGPADKFRDIGIDAQYQFTSDKHIISAQADWIDEKQTWEASFPAEATANPDTSLKSFHLKGSYYYDHLVGGTLGFFATTGSADSGLYAPDPVEGSLAGKPDSRGMILELNMMPKQWTRLGLQYTAYSKFNGSKDNYDGSGRPASDNNTWYLYSWLMF